MKYILIGTFATNLEGFRSGIRGSPANSYIFSSVIWLVIVTLRV